MKREDGMFNVGIAEVILLLMIAFLVVGPKDLPRVARALGRFVRYVRAMIEELKRETGLDEVADELKEINRGIEQDLKEADIRKDLTQTQAEINKSFREFEKEIRASGMKKN